MFERPPVVIDQGSYLIKAGFACDNHPVALFRTTAARPKNLQGRYGRTYYDVLIGDDALSTETDVDYSNPIEEGQVVHWDNMERIWHFILYKELKVAPEDISVILAVSPVMSVEDKVKCCKVFFETLNVPNICIQSQASLSLYGSGLTTGLAVDLGYDTTDISPVYEGGFIPYAHMRAGTAGRDLIRYIYDSITERNIDIGKHPLETCDKIVRTKAYVTLNTDMSRKNHMRSYVLGYKNFVEIGQEAFMAGELYFQPDLVRGTNNGVLSLHDAIVQSCFKIDPELREEMYDNLVLCGGVSMLPGIAERIKLEVENIIDRPINLIRSDEAHMLPWMGAATFAAIPDAANMWISRKQYEEQNIVRLVKNRCM